MASGACGFSGLDVARGEYSESDTIGFFAIGDTHYFANERSTHELMDSSVVNCQGLIDTLNRLEGTPIPDLAGGGNVASIRGVIHAGDIIDTGGLYTLSTSGLSSVRIARSSSVGDTILWTVWISSSAICSSMLRT
jgi:hypothetical protein